MRRLLLTAFASAALFACEKSAPPSEPPPGETVCTMEAKICPDGSAVGRSGPNCEFAPCPEAPATGGDAGTPPDPAPGTETPPVACTKDAKVCPDGSAVGRTGPDCEFAKCPGE